jgi:hypothetical protein
MPSLSLLWSVKVTDSLLTEKVNAATGGVLSPGGGSTSAVTWCETSAEAPSSSVTVSVTV